VGLVQRLVATLVRQPPQSPYFFELASTVREGEGGAAVQKRQTEHALALVAREQPRRPFVLWCTVPQHEPRSTSSFLFVQFLRSFFFLNACRLLLLPQVHKWLQGSSPPEQCLLLRREPGLVHWLLEHVLRTVDDDEVQADEADEAGEGGGGGGGGGDSTGAMNTRREESGSDPRDTAAAAARSPLPVTLPRAPPPATPAAPPPPTPAVLGSTESAPPPPDAKDQAVAQASETQQVRRHSHTFSCRESVTHAHPPSPLPALPPPMR
jgi:hypothetical protein